MLPRIVFGLFTLTLLGVSTVASAQSRQCTDKNFKPIPGYVLASCDDQRNRATKNNCKIEKISIEPCNDPSGICEEDPVQPNDACKDLYSDLQRKSTNFNILLTSKL